MLLLIELIYQHPISRNVQCSVQLPLVSFGYVSWSDGFTCGQIVMCLAKCVFQK
jgi:hypothetical protein